MTRSNAVPSSYTARWNAGVRQPALEPSRVAASVSSGSGSDTTNRKYCSSCNACRKSRVKCSGGQPCQRCAACSTPSTCVYSLSQRRGKRKANDGVLSEGSAQQDVLNPLSNSASYFMGMPDGWIDPNEALVFPPNEPTGLIDPNSLVQTLMPDEIALLSTEPPTLSDFFGSFKSASPPPSSNAESRTCPSSCSISITTVTDNMRSPVDHPEKNSLDKILHLLQLASSHAETYLACPYCENNCPGLMSLAILHQRQVYLLCEIAKNPTAYLYNNANDALRVSLGDYQPSPKDDLMVKRLMLLSLSRSVDSCVDAYHEQAMGFQERDESGEIELGETGTMNLRWLLDVAENLKKRLECIKSLFGKDDWAAHILM